MMRKGTSLGEAQEEVQSSSRARKNAGIQRVEKRFRHNNEALSMLTLVEGRTPLVRMEAGKVILTGSQEWWW